MGLTAWVPFPKRKRSTKVTYPNLTLAERCFDVYAKLGMDASINVKTFTVTLY